MLERLVSVRIWTSVPLSPTAQLLTTRKPSRTFLKGIRFANMASTALQNRIRLTGRQPQLTFSQ